MRAPRGGWVWFAGGGGGAGVGGAPGGGSVRRVFAFALGCVFGERNFAALFEKFSVAETKAGP